ncbi:hypothetical protein [Granulicoccus sp. GXG6511]|uniref:hypothetical protein n=1 Tax=Granulicoccus sp. GXG6511 TaxID=3381351 RepID=UPI003D7E6667
MRRSALDKLISFIGLALAALLIVGGGLLTWASSFVASQVESQLASQRITMPSGPALDALGNEEDKKALEPYAGNMMSTGDEAKAFADHYILNHMNASSDGKTYEEVSGEFMKLEDKTTPEAQQMGQLRQSLFMGNTLRGLLLNAYAFGTMGKIASIAAIAAFVGGVVMLVLSLLGFRHAKSARGNQMVA